VCVAVCVAVRVAVCVAVCVAECVAVCAAVCAAVCVLCSFVCVCRVRACVPHFIRERHHSCTGVSYASCIGVIRVNYYVYGGHVYEKHECMICHECEGHTQFI